VLSVEATSGDGDVSGFFFSPFRCDGDCARTFLLRLPPGGRSHDRERIPFHMRRASRDGNRRSFHIAQGRVLQCRSPSSPHFSGEARSTQRRRCFSLRLHTKTNAGSRLYCFFPPRFVSDRRERICESSRVDPDFFFPLSYRAQRPPPEMQVNGPRALQAAFLTKRVLGGRSSRPLEEFPPEPFPRLFRHQLLLMVAWFGLYGDGTPCVKMTVRSRLLLGASHRQGLLPSSDLSSLLNLFLDVSTTHPRYFP